MASVSIDAESGGTYLVLTVENVGSDQASMLIRTWAPGKRPPVAPKKTDQVKLYKVRRANGSDAITCFADVPGNDPKVLCELQAGNSPQERRVRLVVKGTTFGLGDRDETHALSDAEFQAMRTFFNAANFPAP
ncbi:MAG TPA: hypothetical protein VIN06_04680 [Devosia sp.]